MAIYSVGRRRVILALLLTSALLLTLDLRGNAVIDRVRDAFSRAMSPVEDATGVVTTPVERAWKAITEFDDLERENQALQDRIDRLEGTQAAAEASVIEYQELLALNNLPSLAGIETEVAQVIGATSNNLDQVIEINKGSNSGIQVGMPVVNQAGLIGKITSVNDTTAKVMLVTDSRYTVSVRVTAGSVMPADEEPVTTSPSGLTEEEILDAATTTTTSPTPTTVDPLDPSVLVPDTVLPSGTTLPEGDPGAVTTDPVAPGLEPGLDLGDLATTTTIPPDGEVTDPDADEQPDTTTTTTEPPFVIKEFGALEGRGGNRLPEIRFLQDNPALAVLEVGDLVETAGGSESLAPTGIPVGRVANRADRPGSGGPLLDVELHADIDRLNFVRVVLYKPLSEVEQ